MRNTVLVTGGAVLAAAVTAALVSAPAATAAPAKVPFLQANAAGSTIDGADGTVIAGPTAPTGLSALSAGQQRSNTLASASLPGVVGLGTIATDASTTTGGGKGLTVTSHARTQGISLLGGLVTADAVDTSASLSVKGGVDGTAGTTFANLKVLGAPLTVPLVPNTTITLPGIASVTLDARTVTPGAAAGTATAAAIVVTLLPDSGLGLPSSTITVNPVSASITKVAPGYAPLGGFAFGVNLAAGVGAGTASVGPLGASSMPDLGTDNQVVTNPTLAVDLPSIATVGTVSSSAQGYVRTTGSRSTMKSTLAGINLLGGLITADTLTATARSATDANGAITASADVVVRSLVIAGTRVPNMVAPGTSFPLPGLGSVVVGATATDARGAVAAALTITVSTASLGLSVGTTIQVGFAYATILP